MISPGLDAPKTFYRQAGGNFVSASGDGDVLTQAGSPVTGIINRRLYYPVTVTYTDRDGSTRTFPYLDSSSLIDLSSSPNIASLLSHKALPLTTWNFPTGVKITAQYYNLVAAPDVIGLYSVKNNLGASIVADPAPDIGSATRQPRCVYENSRYHLEWLPARDATVHYTTSGGQTFVVNMGAQQAWNPVNDRFEFYCSNTGRPYWSDGGDGGGPVNQYLTGQTYPLSVTDSAGGTWKLVHGLIADSNPLYFGGYYALSEVYLASDANNPALSIGRGVDANVRTVTDRNGQNWSYFTSAYRFETLSPEQAAVSPANGSVSYFDRWGSAARLVDPLLRVTTIDYDDRGREIQRTFPEGNSELTAYDARNNVTSKTQRGKPGSGLADLVTLAGYVGAASAVTCSNLVTCNKVALVRDPLAHRTSYTWDTTTGLLLTQTSGLNSAGSACLIAATSGGCPQVTYNYSSFAGTDGSNFSLLSSKIEQIDGATARTTSYGYDTANHFVMKEQVLDAGTGTLNLRTCAKYDALGNIISLTKPRGTGATCP